MNKLNEIIERYNDELCIDNPSNNLKEFSKALARKGSLLRSQYRNWEATEVYNDLIIVFSELEKDDYYQFRKLKGIFYKHTAECFASDDVYLLARDNFEKAINIFDELYIYNQIEYAGNLVGSLRSFADFLSKDDIYFHFNQIIELYKKAIDIEKFVLANDNDDLYTNSHNLSNTLTVLGYTYAEVGFLEKAIKLFEEAISIYQTIVISGETSTIESFIVPLINVIKELKQSINKKQNSDDLPF